ncbi:lipopolysaccharide biosynthesis protein [Bacillaceae bacterium W0354]
MDVKIFLRLDKVFEILTYRKEIVMKGKFLQLLRTKFIRNVMVIASGTVLAQIITFLLLPVITRLYGPEAYGLMGAFVAIISIIIPISALSLPIAIVLPEKREEAISIISASRKITHFVALLSFILLLAFHNEFVNILNANDIANYLYLIPIVILLAGYSQILRQWLIRNESFKILATISVYQPLLSNSGIIIVGFFNPVAAVLIMFSVLKTGLAAMLMLIKIRRSSREIRYNLMEANLGLRHILKKYYDFPTYRAPETLISEVSQNLPVLLLTSLSGPISAGFYTLSKSSLLMPVNLVSKAVGDVFYPRIANAHKTGENISKLIKKATLALLGIGIIPFTIIIAFGPWIFSFVFGDEWYIAGEYSRWVSLMALGMFISRPAVKSLPVLNAQRFHLFFTIITTIIRAGALYIGIVILGDELIGIALYGTLSLFLYLILIMVTFIKSMNIKDRL